MCKWSSKTLNTCRWVVSLYSSVCVFWWVDVSYPSLDCGFASCSLREGQWLLFRVCVWYAWSRDLGSNWYVYLTVVMRTRNASYVFAAAGRNSYVPLQIMFIRLPSTLSKTTVFSRICSIYLLKWKPYEGIPTLFEPYIEQRTFSRNLNLIHAEGFEVEKSYSVGKCRTRS